MIINDIMVSRRSLRECAFQTLFSLEFGGEILVAARFAYTYDTDTGENVELPVFLLNLVRGVDQSKDRLDEKISQRLKIGWSLERLTLVEKTILRLGLFELLECEETPPVVSINEAIELAKTFSDNTSGRFVNGILSKFIA